MPKRNAPARHFIESQLSPTLQAFGYAGGWSVERRSGAKRKDPREELATGLPSWPCAGPGCTTMIRWQPKPGKGKSQFRKYCSDRCGWRAREQAHRAPPEQLQRLRERKRRAQRRYLEQMTLEQRREHNRKEWRRRKPNRKPPVRTPEQRARLQEYYRRYHADRTPEQRARMRETTRLAALVRRSNSPAEERRKCAEYARRRRAKFTPEQREEQNRRSCEKRTPEYRERHRVRERERYRTRRQLEGLGKDGT